MPLTRLFYMRTPWHPECIKPSRYASRKARQTSCVRIVHIRQDRRSSMPQLDLLLINPGGRDLIYQDLGEDLAAVEPPLWCRLIAGYALDRGYSVKIIDSEAENKGPEALARDVAELKPRLV